MTIQIPKRLPSRLFTLGWARRNDQKQLSVLLLLSTSKSSLLSSSKHATTPSSKHSNKPYFLFPYFNSSNIYAPYEFHTIRIQLVPDFGGLYLDMGPDFPRYWNFCGIVINICTDGKPYIIGTTHHSIKTCCA